MNDSSFDKKVHPFPPQKGDPGPGGKAKPPKRLALLYGDAATEPQPMGTVVDGLLHVGSLTLVYGPPKSGKSFLLTDLLASVAHGCNEWMGHKIVRPGPIHYVACEGHSGFWKRLRAIKSDRQWGKLANDFVLAIGRPQLIEISDKSRSVGPYPDDVLAALKEMKAKGLTPVVVAIDTVFRSIGAGNVNDSSHMSAYVDAVSTIIDKGIALAIVHHETKAGGTPAGSVSLIGGADTIIQTQTVGDKLHTWEVEMAKDDAPTKPRAFRLDHIDVGLDTDGRPATSCVVRDDGAAPTKKTGRPKGSPAAMNALAALRLAIQEMGEPHHASNHVPTGTRTIKLDVFQTYFVQASVAKTDKAESQQKAFHRVVDSLQAAGFIGIWAGYVWLADK